MANNPDYYFYDPEYAPLPIGFNNTGAICWWNSMLQMLLSFPALNKYILENEEEFASNNFSRAYIDLVKKLLRGPNQVSSMASSMLLNAFAYQLQKARKTLDWRSQEGVVNGLCVFLELFDNNNIYKVVNNKYERIIHCSTCNKDVSVDIDISPIINIYCKRDFKDTADFKKYVKLHASKVDEYTCEKCGNKMKNIIRLEELRMLREIIIITFGKDNALDSRWFPEFINFLSKDDKMLRYRLVAQIEHGGYYEPRTHQSSGHYWAHIFRKNNWYTANDTSVGYGKYLPSKNTHVIAYHLTEHSALTAEEQAAMNIAQKRQ